MRKWIGWVAALAALGAAGTAIGQAPPERPAAAKPGLDASVLHVQVILEKLGFGPGVLDGRSGLALTNALKGFQTQRGLPVTGKPDAATLRALYPYRAIRPVKQVRLSEAMLAGPYFPQFPKDYAEQAKLPRLGYRSPMEKLAEMFHTTPAVLLELNSPTTPLRAGSAINVPNALPGSRNYPGDLPGDWRQTLAMLNVDANQPQGDRIEVDKSEGVLRVFNGERLVAQFTATMGSEYDPLPIGNWKVTVIDRNPDFKYNPKLFWDADRNDKAALMPPGPNGPVGVVWLDLTKEHYGIHGTPSPETIGRSESHGCIRLTNWDAARVAQMVKAGTPAVFKP